MKKLSIGLVINWLYSNKFMCHFFAYDPGISGRICLSFSLIFFCLLQCEIKKRKYTYVVLNKSRSFLITRIGEENLKQTVFVKTEPVAWRCSAKKVLLKILQNVAGNTRTRVTFLRLQTCNFIKKETPVKVFSCEF